MPNNDERRHRAEMERVTGVIRNWLGLNRADYVNLDMSATLVHAIKETPPGHMTLIFSEGVLVDFGEEHNC